MTALIDLPLSLSIPLHNPVSISILPQATFSILVGSRHFAHLDTHTHTHTRLRTTLENDTDIIVTEGSERNPLVSQFIHSKKNKRPPQTEANTKTNKRLFEVISYQDRQDGRKEGSVRFPKGSRIRMDPRKAPGPVRQDGRRPDPTVQGRTEHDL